MIIHDIQTLLLIIVGVILLTVTDPVGDVCEQVTCESNNGYFMLTRWIAKSKLMFCV